MEAVGVALIVFGPIVGFLLLLGAAMRKLRPRPVTDVRRWQGPARGGGPAGVREPRRPMAPEGSGAIALARPSPGDHDDGDDATRIHLGPPDGLPGRRLAG